MNVIESAFFKTDAAPERQGDRLIGAILVDAGRLTVGNADRILRAQKEHGTRFGDAGINLGLLTEEDIRFALARQFDYPYLPSGDVSLSRELIAAYSPFAPLVEQLRVLRSQLLLRWHDAEAGRKTLAVVSTGRREGRSFVAANLAIVFAQLGERTLLIDADLRSPRLHRLFKIEGGPGLSGLLAGRNNAETIVRIPSLFELSVLPAGTEPPNPQELLGRSGFAQTLKTLSREYDVVILDTPPASEYADAHIVAVRAGAALMLARKNHSSLPEMTEFARNLELSGIALVGSVLNEF
ncbi:chain length determinant protein tyrosine kinase EpsG [Propionivibrio soli]|uniref:chain length determinant protein tyrosine kinase EpsG n=1 Tax=Propionivibrio soli TaxID=2976531 RepID=UPI0021E97174|nr:chain length determinant protein tyrosine kinase EpsG [Propionivibrio soli]